MTFEVKHEKEAVLFREGDAVRYFHVMELTTSSVESEAFTHQAVGLTNSGSQKSVVVYDVHVKKSNRGGQA
jgi:hypothetical protein